MKEALYEKIKTSVTKEAKAAEYRWHAILDADDVEQGLWLFIVESPAIQAYLSEAEPGQVKKALKTKADAVCSKERLDYDRFSGNWHYTNFETRELLNKWGEELLPDEESLAPEQQDFTEALKILRDSNPNHYEVLEDKFVAGSQARSGAEKMAVSRAIDKLTEIMNMSRSEQVAKRHEGLGTKNFDSSTIDPDDLDHDMQSTWSTMR